MEVGKDDGLSRMERGGSGGIPANGLLERGDLPLHAEGAGGAARPAGCGYERRYAHHLQRAAAPGGESGRGLPNAWNQSRRPGGGAAAQYSGVSGGDFCTVPPWRPAGICAASSPLSGNLLFMPVCRGNCLYYRQQRRRIRLSGSGPPGASGGSRPSGDCGRALGVLFAAG
ncbi:hypothetical protein D3C75_920590 [compost metagenome]